jgi:hypothetical protein
MLQRWCIVLAALLLTIHSFADPEQTRPGVGVSRGPLSESEIIFLLKSGVTPSRVKALVGHHGLTFTPDASTRERLRAAGGDDQILAQALHAIRAAEAQPTPGPSVTPVATPGPPPSPTPATREPVGTASRQKPDAVSFFEPAAALVRGGPRGDFFMARHETSNADFERYCRQMGVKPPKSPYWGKPSNYPVVNVTWFDAVAYTRWLSLVTGRKYRLPYEAEWEVAARAGIAKLAFPWGDESPTGRACFGKGAPCPRASFAPSRLGLYDMAGSAAEWCADVLSPNSKARTVRGGSWAVPLSGGVRIAIDARERLEADKSRNDVGFRVVREP